MHFFSFHFFLDHNLLLQSCICSSTKKEDDDDLKIVNALEHRNQKVINAVSVYRKHVSNTVKTGLREENVDKRRVGDCPSILLFI